MLCSYVSTLLGKDYLRNTPKRLGCVVFCIKNFRSNRYMGIRSYSNIESLGNFIKIGWKSSVKIFEFFSLIRNLLSILSSRFCTVFECLNRWVYTPDLEKLSKSPWKLCGFNESQKCFFKVAHSFSFYSMNTCAFLDYSNYPKTRMIPALVSL